MAWKEMCVMDERMKFVSDFLRDEWNMSELCRRYEISRRVGYKWLARYHEFGVEGLKDRSRAPLSHPGAIDTAIIERVVAEKRKHIHWGPKKILRRMQRTDPDSHWPVASTIGEILDRHGLVKKRKKRRKATASEQPLSHCSQPNDVWCIDFKGWFRTLNGTRCDPLTLCDASTRFFLKCQALSGKTNTQTVQAVLETAFHEFGLPRAIRSDNGPPFASTGLAGLSRLSVWWIGLGIRPERIRPGHPEENGRLERLHKTLKAETASPPRYSIRQQQDTFNRFREEYNYERPHESLDQDVPADHYTPSSHPFPVRPPKTPDYDHAWHVRKVKPSGEFKWKGADVYATQALAGHYIGLMPTKERSYTIYFHQYPIGKLHEKTMKIQALKKVE